MCFYPSKVCIRFCAFIRGLTVFGVLRANIKAISKTDVFIPLISESFKSSPYCSQETGIAVYLKKKIIPIKLETIDPYGFISKYQALQYKQVQNNYSFRDNAKELVLAVAQIGLNLQPKSSFRQKPLDSVICAFCKSDSFDTANATIQLIMKCKDLTAKNLGEIKQAIKENTQIQNSYGLADLKEFLKETFHMNLD